MGVLLMFFFFFALCVLSGLAGLARASSFAAFGGFVFPGVLVSVGGALAALIDRLGVAGDAATGASILGLLVGVPFNLGFLLLPLPLPPLLASMRGFLSGDLASAAGGAAAAIPLFFRFLPISKRERAPRHESRGWWAYSSTAWRKHAAAAPEARPEMERAARVG